MHTPGAAVAVAVLAGALALAGPASAAVPATFDLSTTAVGVRVTSSQRPAASVVTAGLVDSSAAFSTSALSSFGTAQSQAASAYPGDLVAGGPALLCQNFGPCPFTPPDYPLVAAAAYPTATRASAPGASAHAGVRDTGSASDVARQSAGPVTVESALASTHAWVDGQGAHVRSRSVVTGLTVGPLHVAVLEALDDVDVPTAGPAHDRPRITVSGVTVAGAAATLDDTGVHVAGQGAAATVPALVQQGLQVRLLGATRQDAEGAVRSAAGGLLVSVSVPVSGVPQLVPGLPSLDRRYVGTVLVGGAGAVVSAGSEAGLGLVLPPAAVPGSAASFLTPPAATAPQPAVAPPVGRNAVAPPPQVAAGGHRVLGVLLYPLASVQTVALLLLVLPLLLLGLQRYLVARAWSP